MRLPYHCFYPAGAAVSAQVPSVVDKDPGHRKAVAGIAYAGRKTGPAHKDPCWPVHLADDSQARAAEAAGMGAVDTAAVQAAGIGAAPAADIEAARAAPAAGIGAVQVAVAVAVAQDKSRFD